MYIFPFFLLFLILLLFLLFLLFELFLPMLIFLLSLLFLFFILFLQFYFSYFSSFPTFLTFILPTFLVWSAHGISKNISLLGVRDIKSPPSFRPSRPPNWAPLYRSQWGYGVRGSGYSPRITSMILEVNSLPKIFDSIRIKIVNQLCPLKYFGLPPIGGAMGVGVTYDWHPF